MRQRLKRLEPREHLCTTDDGEAIRHIRGTVVVWWYERIKKNRHAESIPFVEVVFRFLDQHDEPAGVTTASIGVSRLGSFRLGTIWRNGKCIAETDLGLDEEFAVDFTRNAWTYLSVTGHHREYPFFIKDYPLRHVQTREVLTDLLNFPLPKGKNLLIPCIEFLYRCYGSTSDMARILATYPWLTVLEMLFETMEKDPNTWLVQPKSTVPDSDGLFLASIQYDEYAETTARMIYSKLDNARGLKLNETSLQVAPWFQGPARLRCRGRWINDDETFLCLEVTGMSEPLDHPYEVRRPKYTKQDPEHGEVIVDLKKTVIDVPKAQDPFEVTDLEEPDRGAGSWARRDPDFEILEPRCLVTRSYDQRSYSQRKLVTVLPNSATRFSTGDPRGMNKGVGHITHVATRVTGDGGILNAMWIELQRLKKEREGFSSLAWYSERSSFTSDPQFKLHSLNSFKAEDSPTDQARRWLSFPDNIAGVRGILVIRATIDNCTFYLLEIQRKKIRKGTAYEEEKISGLLVRIDDPKEADQELSAIFDQIRFARGRFGQLKDVLSSPYRVFRHISHKGVFSAEATLHKAFTRMGVRLSTQQRRRDRA